jgi:hypothetical protein
MPHRLGFRPAAAETRLSTPNAASAINTIAASSRATRLFAGAGMISDATAAGSSSIGALG